MEREPSIYTIERTVHTSCSWVLDLLWDLNKLLTYIVYQGLESKFHTLAIQIPTVWFLKFDLKLTFFLISVPMRR